MLRIMEEKLKSFLHKVTIVKPSDTRPLNYGVGCNLLFKANFEQFKGFFEPMEVVKGKNKHILKDTNVYKGFNLSNI